MAVRAVFQALAGPGLDSCHPVGQGPPTGRSSSPRRSRPSSLLAVPTRSLRSGRRLRRGYARPWPRRRHEERRRRLRPRNPPERGAVRGRRGGAPSQPPRSTWRVLAGWLAWTTEAVAPAQRRPAKPTFPRAVCEATPNQSSPPSFAVPLWPASQAAKATRTIRRSLGDGRALCRVVGFNPYPSGGCDRRFRVMHGP